MATENLDRAQPASMAAEFAGELNAKLAGGAAHPSGPAVQAPSGHRFARRLNMPNLVLAGLFMGGIACLYLMSLHVGPKTASADEQNAEAKMDAALTQLSAMPKAAQLQKETNAIVNTFYYEAKQRQIPIEQLEGNPFIYTPPVDDLKPPASSDDAPAPPPVPQGAAEAMAAVQQLKLQSVLSGTHGATAMISNNLLSEGQVINGWTVKTIEPRQVLLTWSDQQYLLRMPR